VDHLLTLLADGQVQPASRAALVDYLTHGQSDSMPLSALTASEQERRVRGVAYLIMAGPEYQLA
ncbi:MAG TPA: hypothetical protein VNL15_08690, partial [Dehalococcoidia bacterium]|nr:hypothetical protein [Dehalococcoidia bacterium]